jgi:hypothetical protein
MTMPSDGDMDFDVDQRATELLFMMLGPDFVVHGPDEAIRAVMRNLAGTDPAVVAAREYFLVASDWAGDELEEVESQDPVEVEDAWLGAAASIVAPYGRPVLDPLPADVLAHPDWLTIAVELDRSGPGTVVNVRSLIELLELDGSTVPAVKAQVGSVLGTVCELWRVLGVIDAEDRLTQLGAWGVPVALLDAWERPGEDDAD